MARMQELQEQIPVKTKSFAIIAAIHELSGLDREAVFDYRINNSI